MDNALIDVQECSVYQVHVLMVSVLVFVSSIVNVRKGKSVIKISAKMHVTLLNVLRTVIVMQEYVDLN